MSPFALPNDIYHMGLIFLRIGAMTMLLPGIGDTNVPPRVRLGLALMLSMCLSPIAGPTLPPIPATLGVMVGQVIKETVIGLMIGLLMQLMVSSLAVAGEVISIQTTLAFSQTANPTEAQPTASISSFLTVMATALIFATDLDHLFIGAMARSYALFPPVKAVPLMDAATLAIQTVGNMFALGLQLAAPIMVFSIVFNVAIGLIGRMLPQFQVFFVASPLHVLFGLSIFALSLGGVALVWLEHYRTFLQVFA